MIVMGSRKLKKIPPVSDKKKEKGRRAGVAYPPNSLSK
jgi:hypothetical protein